jgi:hypothetical protein
MRIPQKATLSRGACFFGGAAAKGAVPFSRLCEKGTVPFALPEKGTAPPYLAPGEYTGGGAATIALQRVAPRVFTGG